MALVIAVVLLVAMAMPAFAAVSDASDTYPIKVEVNGIEDGNTLTLYKIVQFNYDAETNDFNYTLASGLPADYDTIEELAALTPDGYSLAEGSTIKAAADALAYGIANGDITPIGTAVTATASGDKATIATCPAGWYVAVVTGTADTGIIYQNMIIDAMPVVDSANNTYKANDNVSFDVKHSDEKITKGVGDDPDHTAAVDTTDKYSVGDKVPYEIKTNIPNYPNPSKVATFKITDTPSDLTDIIDATGADKMTVTINGTEVARSADLTSAGATYTVTQSGDGFIIEFAKDYILAHPGQSVVVNYKATIKESATIAADGETASNTAKLTFNPNPNDDSTVEPDDTTKDYTYGINVLKFDESSGAAKTPLKGAEFELQDADGNVIKAAAPVDSNGYISWNGLAAGTYKIVETKAPAGFKLDSTPHEVTLSSTTATTDDRASSGTTETNFLQSDIPNTPGTTLPSTGGIGTTLFYIIGGCIVAAAVIALVARRKAKAEQ